jgi:hypothetical protein
MGSELLVEVTRVLTEELGLSWSELPPVETLFGHLVLPKGASVRCAFLDGNLHSMMPLDPTHVRLKRTGV